MPLLAGLGISAAASIFGAVSANNTASKAQKEAAKLQQQALDRLTAIGIPSAEAMNIILTDPKKVGEMVPELEGMVAPLESAALEINTNPELKKAQMDALGSLQERAQGGLTAQDKMDINKVRRDTAGQLQGQDATIMQNMEQRGLGGGGSELAMRIAAKGQAQSRASEEADRLAATNYNAKMAALSGAGNMAGNMRSQDYKEQSGKAAMLDSLSQFNQQNQINLGNRNVNRSNLAQADNLKAAQDLENKRAANRNTEEVRRSDNLVTKFDMDYKKAGGVGDSLNKSATNIQKAGATEAANTQNMWNGIGKIAQSGIKVASDGGLFDSEEKDAKTSLIDKNRY